jgi:acetyl-CoA synthetase
VTAAGGSQARLIITDAANAAKLADVPGCPPTMLVAGPGSDFAVALAAQPTRFDPVMLRGEDPFVVIFTSGTTGAPKGVLYPLSLLLPIAVYMRDGIGLQDGDRYWNMADPGWAYGMLYAVIGPLLLGWTTTLYDGPFSVEGTVQVIVEAGITNLAAAPTAYRMLMAAGAAALAPIAGRLRLASSEGEPLNPEVARWALRALGCALCDHYGQTELGMLVNNHHALRHPVKPGSAGVPMPGFTLAVLDENLQVTAPNTPGCLRSTASFPRCSRFRAIGAPTRRACKAIGI